MLLSRSKSAVINAPEEIPLIDRNVADREHIAIHSSVVMPIFTPNRKIDSVLNQLEITVFILTIVVVSTCKSSSNSLSTHSHQKLLDQTPVRVTMIQSH